MGRAAAEKVKQKTAASVPSICRYLTHFLCTYRLANDCQLIVEVSIGGVDGVLRSSKCSESSRLQRLVSVKSRLHKFAFFVGHFGCFWSQKESDRYRVQISSVIGIIKIEHGDLPASFVISKYR